MSYLEHHKKQSMPCIKLLMLFILFGSKCQLYAQLDNLQSINTQNQNVPTVKSQLDTLNSQWLNKGAIDPVLKERIPLNNDVSLIQMHLSLVEKNLREKDTDGLSQQQKANRNHCLDILHEYWEDGVFPKNLYHKERTPYFIDDFGTACAVGQLMISTGFGDVAQKISQENNNAYVDELDAKYPELKLWAKQFGFTVDELAWIQPSYGGGGSCNYSNDTTAQIINVSCHNVQNGCFLPPDPNSWGTPPFNVTNCAGFSTYHCCSLGAGNYCVRVVDSLGDYREYPFTITEPDMLQVNATPIAASPGACDGIINVSVAGGTPPYDFSWNIGGNDSIMTGLCPGTYYVTVSDAHGCIRPRSAQVIGLTISLDSLFDLYNFLEGRWEYVDCSGGIFGYCPIGWPESLIFVHLPSDSLFTAIFDPWLQSTSISVPVFQNTIFGPKWVLTEPIINFGYPPLSYMPILITDSLNINFTIDAYDAYSFHYRRDTTFRAGQCSFTTSISSTNDSCNGGNGSASVLVTGNFAPFTYQWNTSPPQNSDTITGLSAGTYTVTVTDFSGCIVVDSVEIFGLVLYDTTLVTVFDTNVITTLDTTVISVFDTIVNSVYDTTHIQIFDTTLSTVFDTTIFTVYDSISVTDTLFIDVVLPGSPPADYNTIKVYPNPSSDHIIIDNGNYPLMGNYFLKITDLLGQVVFQSTINQQQFNVDLNTFGSYGTYLISIYDQNNNLVTFRKIILK